jgi:glycosyltransferase involved in cell wall biosynthesis
MNQLKKTIAIDCRFWGIKHAGLGRYTKNLVINILKNSSSQNHSFILIYQKGDSKEFEELNSLPNTTSIELDAPHYSLKEQITFPKLLSSLSIDLLHVPHFNIPLISSVPLVITIHDLIKHFFKGKPVTTRNTLVYWMKYGGYRYIIRKAIEKSKKIIVPSVFTKDQIRSHYQIDSKKITVIYEGVEPLYQNDAKPSSKLLKKYQITHPYFVYTGSAYPSKNIPVLLSALKNLTQTNPKVQLLIACARNHFWEKLQLDVRKYGLSNNVLLPGRVPDEDLALLYQKAQAFIMPSLMEGFGLPGLEALSAGCPVISSETGSLPEIYEKAASYFHPQDPQALTNLMSQYLHFSEIEKEKIVQKGKIQASKYSWEKAAQQTIDIYDQILNL